MIDKVILYDIKCGKNYISTLQARQILGRAGRTYNKFQQGQTYIFGKEQQLDKINQYYYGQDNIVKSNLIDLDVIAFHILPDIKCKSVKTKKDLEQWYDKTLAKVQNNNVNVDDLYNYLIENNCINEKFELQHIGKLSIDFYFSPNRINVLVQKFKHLQTIQDFSLMAFAWAFSYYKIQKKINHPLYEQFDLNVSSKFYLNGQLIDFFVNYLILNNTRIKQLDTLIGKNKKDFLRLIALTKCVFRYFKINKEKQLKILETMLYYRVSMDGAKLMHDIECYDVNVIRKLLQIQVTNYKELQYNLDFINSFYEDKFSDACNKIVQERQKNVL